MLALLISTFHQWSSTEAVYAAPNSQEIAVSGNGVTIDDGDTTPDASDDTDFGSTLVGNQETHTFTIQNSNSTILELSPANLTAHYKFEEGKGSSTTAESVGGGTLDLTNMDAGTDWILSELAPVHGGTTAALDFDGTDDYLVATGYNNASGTASATGYKGVSGTAARTVALWMKASLSNIREIDFVSAASVNAPAQSLVSWGSVPGSGEKFDVLMTPAGQLGVDITGETVNGTATIKDGNWHCVAATWANDGSPSLQDTQLYVDGNLDPLQISAVAASTSASLATFNTGEKYDVHIGASVTNISTSPFVPDNGTYFRGQLDDVRIYDRALSAEEIRALCNSLSVQLTSGKPFSVTTQPAVTSLGNGESTTFNVTFAPTATGEYTDTVLVINNDSDEGIYNFDVKGTGISPEIDVRGNDTSIPDGQTTASTANDTDWDWQVLNTAVKRTFTISNTGSSPLNLTSLTVSGPNASNFVATQPAVNSVAANGSTTFDITFTPTEANVTGVHSATITILSDDLDEATFDFVVQGKGYYDTPSITVADVTASEAGGTMQFVLSMSTPYTDDVTVQYQTSASQVIASQVGRIKSTIFMPILMRNSGSDADGVVFASAFGTAVDGTDFVSVNSTLTFAVGEQTKQVDVTINDNATVDGHRSFYLHLSNPTNATLADSSATGTIIDNETSTTISVNDPAVNEGASEVVFTIGLNTPYPNDITVGYSTSNIKAIAGEDYIAKSGSAVILAGATGVNVTVDVISSIAAQGNRDFKFNLNSASAGTIIDNFGIGTIVDTNTTTSTPTATATETATATGTATATATVTETNTISETVTPTMTPTATETATTTATVTETNTISETVTPTATPTATSTPISTPTATQASEEVVVPTATGTNTSVPVAPTATGTNTSVPAAPTATGTNTPVPAAPTVTGTNTPVPAVPTATGTNTPVPAVPTATGTNTPVPAVPTTTATATATDAPVPVAPDDTPTPMPTATPFLPVGGLNLLIEEGDELEPGGDVTLVMRLGDIDAGDSTIFTYIVIEFDPPNFIFVGTVYQDSATGMVFFEVPPGVSAASIRQEDRVACTAESTQCALAYNELDLEQQTDIVENGVRIETSIGEEVEDGAALNLGASLEDEAFTTVVNTDVGLTQTTTNETLTVGVPVSEQGIPLAPSTEPTEFTFLPLITK